MASRESAHIGRELFAKGSDATKNAPASPLQNQTQQVAPYAPQRYQLSARRTKNRGGDTKNRAALVAADEWMQNYGGADVVVAGDERTAEVTVKRL